MRQRINYRSVFISDLHFGARACKAKQLLAFLKSIECEYLYLVGDVFDFIAMRGRTHWDEDTTAVIRRILKMMKHGTKVIYVPGNHDEEVRKFIPLALGSEFIIVNEIVHTTTSGKSFLVVHGDIFDFVVGHLKWLTILGSRLYDSLLQLNGLVHRLRVSFGSQRYWSLSAYLKAKAKQAVSFIDDFETAALMYAKSKNCVGVICGHIHTAKLYTKDGMTYANCGDWVESLTAQVEHTDGTLELLHWHSLDDEGVHDLSEESACSLKK